MPEYHLKQPGFNYSGCGPFTKHCERILKFREAGNLIHLCRNELDKVCFAHDAAYSDSIDLTERIVSDKTLKYRPYEIATNPNYDGYQRALAYMVYKIFDKKTGSGASVNEQLAEELNKPVIKNFKRGKVLAEMGSLSSKNKYVKYLLCIIDVFIKYAWVKPLKDKEK